MTSTPPSIPNETDSAVPPPSALRAASEDEALRAQRNIEARERKLNNPFHRFFSRRNDVHMVNSVQSDAFGGDVASSTEQGDSMLVTLQGRTAIGYDSSTIVLKDTNLPEPGNWPDYRWAVVYENQRGYVFVVQG
jgi:hypothetical protein